LELGQNISCTVTLSEQSNLVHNCV
jgi:hypothetical protein